MPLLAGGRVGGLCPPRFSTRLGAGVEAGRPHPPLPVGTTSCDTACALAVAVMIPPTANARPRFLSVMLCSYSAELSPFPTDSGTANSRPGAPGGSVRQRPGEPGRRGRGQGEHPAAVTLPPPCKILAGLAGADGERAPAF